MKQAGKVMRYDEIKKNYMKFLKLIHLSSIEAHQRDGADTF